MKAERFALLGYGRFGQAFAELLQGAGHSVAAFDPVAAVPAALAARNASAACVGADWIVLAMPVKFLRPALAELRPLLGRQTVIDVGSVKSGPCASMDALLGEEIPHAGTHPLFGPLSLARGDRPLRVAVCPSSQHPDAATRTAELYQSLGCEVIELDAESHDRAMASTHAMAFFLAKGLIEMGVDDELALAPPSFQGMRRMLDAVRGDAGHLFATIQRENPFAAQARANMLRSLEQVHMRLMSESDDASLAIAESAAAAPSPAPSHPAGTRLLDHS